MVRSFTCIPKVGPRFYFSFSSVINASKGQQDKLVARMRAVPDDRLLIECVLAWLDGVEWMHSDGSSMHARTAWCHPVRNN